MKEIEWIMRGSCAAIMGSGVIIEKNLLDSGGSCAAIMVGEVIIEWRRIGSGGGCAAMM